MALRKEMSDVSRGHIIKDVWSGGHTEEACVLNSRSLTDLKRREPDSITPLLIVPEMDQERASVSTGAGDHMRSPCDDSCGSRIPQHGHMAIRTDYSRSRKVQHCGDWQGWVG